MKFELTFKQKVRVVAVLVATISLIIAGAGFLAQTRLSAAMSEIDAAAAGFQGRAEAARLHERLRGEAYRALWAGTNAPAQSGAIAAALAGDAARLHALTPAGGTARPAATSEASEALQPVLESAIEAARRVAALAATDPAAAARETTALDARFDALGTRYADLMARLAERSRTAAAGARAVERTNSQMLLAALAIAMILTALTSVLLHRQIYVPLEQVAIHLQNIADGTSDLSIRLDDSKSDEIAWIAGSFNRFVRKIRKAMQAVASTTEELARASGELSEMSSRARSEVQQQQSEVEHVSTAVVQMAEASDHVAGNATATAGAVSATNDQAQSVRGTVSDVLETFSAMATEITAATEVIRRLEGDCKSIGSVLEVIGGIAAQTNLLALNAAIEAARAGDMGRGFAVVADEVRTLAGRTQQATLEIQETMESLRRDAHAAVDVIQASQRRAGETAGKACSASEALDGITTRVAALAAMNEETASAAEEQSRVADQIREHITRIRETTTRTAEEADYTADSAENLAALAAKLAGAVSQFKLA